MNNDLYAEILHARLLRNGRNTYWSASISMLLFQLLGASISTVLQSAPTLLSIFPIPGMLNYVRWGKKIRTSKFVIAQRDFRTQSNAEV